MNLSTPTVKNAQTTRIEFYLGEMDEAQGNFDSAANHFATALSKTHLADSTMFLRRAVIATAKAGQAGDAFSRFTPHDLVYGTLARYYSDAKQVEQLDVLNAAYLDEGKSDPWLPLWQAEVFL